VLSHDLSPIDIDTTISALNNSELNNAALNSLIITYQPPLSLAMCYELESHLGQIDGITANLIWQDHDYFDYEDSQIAAIAIESKFKFELDLLAKDIDSDKALNHQDKDIKQSLDLTSLSFLCSNSRSDLTEDLRSNLEQESPKSQTASQIESQVRNKILGLILNHYGVWQIKGCLAN
jgi:hypothetical protein